MPYARKYRTTGRDRRRRGRRKTGAASTIQSAWRRRQKRKRGSLLSRTALANRKAIKQIKRDDELKFIGTLRSSPLTNFTGQIMQAQEVDNWGMPQSTEDWVNAGAGATTLAPNSKYCPVIMQPVCLKQSTEEDGRVGNDIVMSHLTIKGQINAGAIQKNGGHYTNVPAKQRVHCLVVLDRKPVIENSTLTAAVQSFQPQAVPCQLYQPTPDNPLPASTNVQYNSLIFNQLRSIGAATANPPGPSTGQWNANNRDTYAMSYYSKDYVMGKSGRFKVLAHKSWTVTQGNFSPATGTVAFSRNRATCPFSFTVKGKYKFHFANDKSVLPRNQNLLVFWFSDVPTIRSTTSAAPSDWQSPPLITCVSRFSFRDQ